MKIKAKAKIGSVVYTFEDEGDLKEVMYNLITMTRPRSKCNVCGDVGFDNKYMTSNKDKDGNVYVNVKCKCGATSNLGTHKTGKSYFWKDYSVYKPKE